jgi:hypothetical protein
LILPSGLGNVGKSFSKAKLTTQLITKAMRAPAKRKGEKSGVFYLIIAAALLYNLFLLFASKEHHPNSTSENEFTTSTLTK